MVQGLGIGDNQSQINQRKQWQALHKATRLSHLSLLNLQGLVDLAEIACHLS